LRKKHLAAASIAATTVTGTTAAADTPAAAANYNNNTVAGKAPLPSPPSLFSVTFYFYFSFFSSCHPNEK
jgi:hypothetical protein